MISACLSQGKYDIHHPHVKPSSHLGSSNLDPYVIPHPQTKAVTPHHYSLPLRSIVKQGYKSSVQTPDPVQTSTLWLTGDLRVCSLSFWDPTSLPTQVPNSSLPSLPSHQKIHQLPHQCPNFWSRIRGSHATLVIIFLSFIWASLGLGL